MLFVCVSHFGWAYFGRLPSHESQRALLEYVSLIASPTFVTISGLLLGFLARTRSQDFAVLRAKLVDRGLFMLTIGHGLIALAHVPMAGGIGPALEWGFITDVIAVGLLIGPFLIEHVRPGHRLALAGAAYTLSWIGVATWRPESTTLERAKEYLLGPSHFLGDNPRLVSECFPLIPWLAVYVAATVLGEYPAARGRGTQRPDHSDAASCGDRLRARGARHQGCPVRAQGGGAVRHGHARLDPGLAASKAAPRARPISRCMRPSGYS